MKEFEDDDPMELQGVRLPEGNPEYEARCMVEEFFMMGMSNREIAKLFSDPFYFGTHRLTRILGMERIQTVIDQVTTVR
jgi:hypothetical protein